MLPQQDIHSSIINYFILLLILYVNILSSKVSNIFLTFIHLFINVFIIHEPSGQIICTFFLVFTNSTCIDQPHPSFYLITYYLPIHHLSIHLKYVEVIQTKIEHCFTLQRTVHRETKTCTDRGKSGSTEIEHILYSYREQFLEK